MTLPIGHTVSWFAFPEAKGCKLTGVRWPFARRKLTADGFHSLSNEPVAAIRLEQKSGRSVLAVSLFPQNKTSPRQ
jgi:hypothetical protein